MNGDVSNVEVSMPSGPLVTRIRRVVLQCFGIAKADSQFGTDKVLHHCADIPRA